MRRSCNISPLPNDTLSDSDEVVDAAAVVGGGGGGRRRRLGRTVIPLSMMITDDG